MMTPDDLDVYGHFCLGLLPTMDGHLARTRHKHGLDHLCDRLWAVGAVGIVMERAGILPICITFIHPGSLDFCYFGRSQRAIPPSAKEYNPILLSGFSFYLLFLYYVCKYSVDRGVVVGWCCVFWTASCFCFLWMTCCQYYELLSGYRSVDRNERQHDDDTGDSTAGWESLHIFTHPMFSTSAFIATAIRLKHVMSTC